MQSSRPLDSFGPFLNQLRSVKKRIDIGDGALDRQQLAVLQRLKNHPSPTIAELSSDLDLSLSRLMSQLGQLLEARAIEIDQTTDKISLTEIGRTVAAVSAQLAGDES